jgi:hypothetical protein
MKMNYKISIVAILLFVAILNLQSQNIFGQNFILLNKIGRKNKVFMRVGNNLKVETINNQIIKGRITNIKDSSIIITSNKSDNTSTDIAIKDIKSIYNFKKKASGIVFGGLLSALPSAIATGYVFGDIVFNQMDEQSHTTIDASTIPVAIIGVGLTVLVSHAIFHRKEYDIKNKYELIIVKPKSIDGKVNH